MEAAFSDCAIDLRIDDVIVGDRVRKGLGDIVALQVSMTRLGQLQPIGVTAGNVLVFGWRRFEAARVMGWPTIRAVRLDSLTQAQQLALAEQDENTCREPFTPLELLELSKRIDAALPAKKTGPKQPEELVPKFGTNSEPVQDTPAKPKKKRREQVAAAVGTSHENLRKIEAVAKAADAEPEKFAPVVAEMERTGKVEPAYQAVKQAEPEVDTGESLRTRILDRIGSELERLIRQLCDTEAGRNVDRARALECLGKLVAAVKGQRRRVAASPADETDRQIEALWVAYPRKVGKGQARRAMLAALKVATFDVLLAAVEEYREAKLDEDMQYIPHPATWFNGRRWEDDRSDWRVRGGPPDKASGLRAFVASQKQWDRIEVSPGVELIGGRNEHEEWTADA